MRFISSDYTERFGQEEYDALIKGSTATFTVAVQDALDELDSKLHHLGQSLDPLPSLTKFIIADLVRARLFRDNPNPHVLNRQSEARQLLLQIAEGKISLNMPSPQKLYAKHPAKAQWGFGLNESD